VRMGVQTLVGIDAGPAKDVPDHGLAVERAQPRSGSRQD
jgi:hypothetical protein